MGFVVVFERWVSGKKSSKSRVMNDDDIWEGDRLRFFPSLKLASSTCLEFPLIYDILFRRKIISVIQISKCIKV